MNFRSFPSIRSRDGRRVRSQYLYRGAAPRLPYTLAALDIALAADLRHPDERPSHHADASVWPCAIVGMETEYSGDAPHLSLMNGTPLDESSIDRYYMELYRDLAISTPYRALFGRFLRAAAADSGKVFVFCAAGKDRTGILTAIIGHILGLDRDDIMSDYLLSNDDMTLFNGLADLVRENARKSSAQIVTDALVKKILGVSPSYLDVAFDEITTRFTSVDGYLDAIGVTVADRDAIRLRLLV